MTKKEIINSIESKVGSSSYSSWTIGLTDDPVERKAAHKKDGKNVSSWEHWETDFEQVGRDVEQYFIKKGMKGGTGGDTGAQYVYVF